MNGVLKKGWNLLMKRPGHVYSAFRQYALFVLGDWRRRLFGDAKGVEMGPNVRIQRLGSLVAEAPGGKIVVGRDSIVYEKASVAAYGQAQVEIGEGSVLGEVRIVSKVGVRIGKRFLSSWNVFIQDYDPHPVDPSLRRKQMEELVDGFKPALAPPPPRSVGPRLSELWSFPGAAVSIGDDVWIGANCSVLKGARIGDGCIVATGSVVTRGEYPANSILAGNPARVIKTIGQGSAEVPARKAVQETTS